MRNILLQLPEEMSEADVEVNHQQYSTQSSHLNHQELMRAGDVDGDGKIDLQEFGVMIGYKQLENLTLKH